MNKIDLAETMSSRNGLSIKKNLDYINSLFGVLSDALENGQAVAIRNFGTLEVKPFRNRKGYDFKNKSTMPIEDRKRVVFKQSEVLSNKINESPT